MIERGPYARVAHRYDDLIGREFFRGLRTGFEVLVRRHRIRFASAADVGSGTGRFARYLSRRYRIPVFAVERSPAMVRVAQARGGQASGVVHVRQDMRRMSLPRSVDLVTANHDTVNHLLSWCDVRAFLRRVADNLNPGGHLVFDVLTPEALRGPALATLRVLPGPASAHSIVRPLPGDRFVTEVTIRSPGGRIERIRNVERAYPVAPLRALLADIGMPVVSALDAADLGPATHRTGRALILARKRPRRSPEPVDMNRLVPVRTSIGPTATAGPRRRIPPGDR